MHPFFDLVERLGLKQRRIAALMGYGDEHFSRVKAGIYPATAKFQRRAIDALVYTGVRQPDGTAYTGADLFLPAVDGDVTNTSMVRTMAEVA